MVSPEMASFQPFLTPSVGLYVDNIPYIDKSAFDFDYSDIERIDVLRGPC